jgi:hypothetical protein|tara:strand:+ start:682 stop:1023 length:342 start_codon:yes stop_codon:yes gene_type:complete
MNTEMTFAPGWTQIIDRKNVDAERADLACYISDTFKALNGIRPRWWDLREWSLDDLRAEADDLEVEVKESIDRQKRDNHERMLEANRVAVIHRAAKKPLPRTYKPFSTLEELL